MRDETIENYCKIISKCCSPDGARSIDIANKLNISKISVSLTLQKLKSSGYIDMKPYKKINLTKKGEAVAIKVCKKHKIIKDFLKTCLKLDENDANSQACLLEHRMNESTLNRLSDFISDYKKTK